MKLEFRQLYASEIEARVQKVSQYSVLILLYKDARCDQNILDETVGPMGWQRHHSRDNANCTVSIWDDDKQQWVEKEDTGTESYTEKEKGLASDSFKRACFNWGIGRELYTAPKVSFKISDTKAEGGKCYDDFEVTAIEYEGNRISMLEVTDISTGAKFKWGGKPQRITQEQRDYLKERLEKADDGVLQKYNISMGTIKVKYGVQKLEELTLDQYSDLCAALASVGV